MSDGIGDSSTRGFSSAEFALAGLAWRGTAVGKGCSICLRVISVQDAAFVLPCHREHCFHEHCIEPWLRQSPSCPVCRQDCRDVLKATFDWPSDESCSREVPFPEEGFGTWGSQDLFSHEFASQTQTHSDSDDARDQDRAFGGEIDPRSYQAQASLSPTVARLLHEQVARSERTPITPRAPHAPANLAERVNVRPRVQAQSVAATWCAAHRPDSVGCTPPSSSTELRRSSSGTTVSRSQHKPKSARPRRLSSAASSTSSSSASMTGSTCHSVSTTASSHFTSCSSSVLASSSIDDASVSQMSTEAFPHNCRAPTPPTAPIPPRQPRPVSSPSCPTAERHIARNGGVIQSNQPRVAPSPRAKFFRPASRTQDEHSTFAPPEPVLKSRADHRSPATCSMPGTTPVREDAPKACSPIVMRTPTRTPRATSEQLEKVVATGMPHSSWVFDNTDRVKRSSSFGRIRQFPPKPKPSEHDRILTSSVSRQDSPCKTGTPGSWQQRKSYADTSKAWESDSSSTCDHWEPSHESNGSARSNVPRGGLNINPSEWEVVD